MTESRRTPLYDLHLELGARMVDFAGWAMPVQYPAGVLAEHNHTRAAASLFDVSHMGQVILRGADAAARLESLVPADIIGLAPGRQRYGLFTGADGGILDDLMIANKGGHLLLVVNAARAEHDLAHLQTIAGPGCMIEAQPRALIALQGPQAVQALAALVPGVEALRFMDAVDADWQGVGLWLTRSGYTGEDGFEISIPADAATGFARALLAQPGVQPAGLGARDSLRLEAGLPLYGHDMDTGTLPGEAGLGWSIQKIRREGGARAGGFPGADRVLADLAAPERIRRGLRPDGRAPIREGVALFTASGEALGTVTSGTFGPTVGAPVAMALLPAAITPGMVIEAELRGRRIPVTVTDLPFVPPSYKR